MCIAVNANALGTNEAWAKEQRARVPALERSAAVGDYTASFELAQLYQNGASYCREPLLYAGGGGVCDVTYAVKPDDRKLRLLLEKLASKGDLWAIVQLAWLHGHMCEEGFLCDLNDSVRKLDAAFTPNPELALRLYGQAAALAPAIFRGDLFAVYQGNNAVPVSLQEKYLKNQHDAILVATRQLAFYYSRTPDRADFGIAYYNYDVFRRLVETSPFFKPGYEDSTYAELNREAAILAANSLLASGGKGLVVDCPRALKQLQEHSEAFPDRWSQPLISFTQKEVFGKLQSTIGLLYYQGCTGQPADRDKALFWLDREPPKTYIPAKYPGDQLTQPALLAWAELLDHGTTNQAPRPRDAFNAYSAVSYKTGPVLVRLAQMLENGLPYVTKAAPNKARDFYCRAAKDFLEPTAEQWLQKHSDIQC